MKSGLTIPQGADIISLELTVKEAMVLASGVHFASDTELPIAARKKVLRAIERKLLPATSQTIDYQLLEM
jgi:hypothetical protein